RMPPCQNETTSDRAHRRTLIRHEVMPALRRVHPGAEANLARSAELLGELEDLLTELAGQHVEEQLDLERLAQLPAALRSLVLHEAAEQAAGRPLRLSRDLTKRLCGLGGRRGGGEARSRVGALQ